MPDADEIRKRYTNLRTEYLEEEDTYGYPVNGREHLLAVVKIDKTVNEEHLQEKKKLLHSIMENVSMAMDRIEVTIERVRDRESMEREKNVRIFCVQSLMISGHHCRVSWGHRKC